MNGHEYSRLLPQVLPGLRHGNVSGARDASPGSWARSRAVAAPRALSFWGAPSIGCHRLHRILLLSFAKEEREEDGRLGSYKFNGQWV